MNKLGLRNLVGLPVIDLNLGCVIGEVKDIAITSHDEVRLSYLLLKPDGLFRELRAVKFEDVFSFGRSSITVADQSVAARFTELADGKPDSVLVGQILGADIKTFSGDLIGNTEDLFVDPSTGKISAIEVSQGVINDVLNGRRQLEISEEILITKDSFLVPDQLLSFLDTLHETSGKENSVE